MPPALLLVQSVPASEYVPGARVLGAEVRPADETVTAELKSLDTVSVKSYEPLWLLWSAQVPDTE